MKKSRMLVALLTLSVVALSVTSTGAAEPEQPKKKEKAVKLTMNDLPPVVKATLQQQVGGGKIVDLKQKMKKGRAVFHADVLTNGKDWEIDVVADGTLLKNKAGKNVDDCSDIPGKKCKDDCDDVPGKNCSDDCEYRKGAPAQCEKSCPLMKARPSN
jgi:hypothetical protein